MLVLLDCTSRSFNVQRNNRQEKNDKRHFSTERGETSRESNEDNKGKPIFLFNLAGTKLTHSNYGIPISQIKRPLFLPMPRVS